MTSTAAIAPGAQSFTLPGSDVGVLIIHGYGGSIGDYRSFADHLHQRGYTIHGMRVAGHGQGHHALRATGPADWRRSVDEAMTRIRLDCRRLVIMGGSFGADLAIDAIHRHPGVFSGLVTVNGIIWYQGEGGMREQLVGVLRRVTPYYPKLMTFSLEEHRRRQALGSVSAWPIDGLQATRRFIAHQVAPILPLITVPALTISSRRDPWVNPRSSQYLNACLGSTDKRLEIVPSLRHNCFRDQTSRRMITELVLGFLADIT